MMRLTLASLLIFTALASPVFAQSFEGSWSCRDTNGTRTGLLSIFTPSYGFAALTPGDTLSGIGAVTAYDDGVTINDGPLRAIGGVTIGRLVPDDVTGVSLRLESDSAALMSCTAL